MGGCGSPFICLSLCLSVGPARGWGEGGGGGGVGGGGGGGGLSTVKGEGGDEEVAGGSQSRTI